MVQAKISHCFAGTQNSPVCSVYGAQQYRASGAFYRYDFVHAQSLYAMCCSSQVSRSTQRTIALSAASALLVAACAQSGLDQGSPQTASIGDKAATRGQTTDAKAKAVKIALILPLGGYGEPAQIARGMKQAAEMALFEADNPAIQLITKDDGGTPAGAMAAADAAIAEGAEIILGPLFGKSASAVAPIASKANVPVVAFSNDPRSRAAASI